MRITREGGEETIMLGDSTCAPSFGGALSEQGEAEIQISASVAVKQDQVPGDYRGHFKVAAVTDATGALGWI